MRKLLIADCNEDFLLSLAERIQDRYHVLTCRSGQKALELLRREQPQILVLDLMLPQLDGLTLLENAAAEGIHPRILATTPLLTDYVLDTAQRLGISYLIRKPCDLDAAVARIDDLCREPSPKEALEIQLPQLLQTLSISNKHDGRTYCILALQIALENPDFAITKDIYPAVAKGCGCNAQTVEHSMRMALDAAWKRGDPALWQSYFPGLTRRPSNMAFLRRMAQALQEPKE